MGAPVLKGGFTTFLGTLVLSFTSSLIFRTFFKLLFSTVVLGVLHGLYFAPVALRVRIPRQRKRSTKHGQLSHGYACASLLTGSCAHPAAAGEREYVPTSVEPPESAPAYEKRSRADS